MQNLSSSKYDNVIENAISNLQNINNIQESNFKLMESNISNNFSQSNIHGNQDGMKENSFDNESFSILNSVYLPNESEINNSNFNESKYDDIFNSKISNLNICNNIQENKIPNQSIILKNEFQEFELFNPKIARSLFTKDDISYTISRNTPPASYGEHADVKEAFVANGAFIDGKVEHSIISRYVKVEEGAKVKNSIILTNIFII